MNCRVRVNLLLWLHRGGQVHSISLLREFFESQGCKVRTVITTSHTPGEAFRADVNLFSSEIHPAWLPFAEQNILIPNLEQDCRQSSIALRPERFAETRDQLRYLRLADKLLAKTHIAQETYSRLGLPVAYIGFTSRDRFLADVAKKNAWLCVVGDNFGNKDLQPVLRVWERNPDFPLLTIVLREPPFALPQLPNVIYHQTYLDDRELRVLQNRCAIHLCPSAMEGFGHSIVESLSTGALVITANAPPMSEHVNESRGVLYEVGHPTPHAFASKWKIDEASVEQAVRRVLNMSDHEKQTRMTAARGHFLNADEQFRANLIREWQSIVAATAV